MVLGGHLVLSGTAPAALSRAAPLLNGELGVRLFFVISGFLITTLLLREQRDNGAVSLRNFYARRFIRLAPVQLAFIATLFALTQLASLSMTPCRFVTALSYTKNYACAGWIDVHLWSLSVEEQFYLLWPVVLVRAPRRAAVVMAVALIAISPVSRAIEYQNGGRQFFWLTSNADALMMGCLLGVLSASMPDIIAKTASSRPTFVRAALIAVIAGQEALKQHVLLAKFTVTVGPIIQSAAVAALILSLTHWPHGLLFRALNLRPVALIGTLSYSIYVWQQIFFSPPETFALTATPWALTFPHNILLCFGVGLFSYYGIERPLLSFKRRFQPARLSGAVFHPDVVVDTCGEALPGSQV